MPRNVVISGKLAPNTVLSGNNTNRIFTIPAGINLHMEALKFQDASESQNGGALYILGDVQLTDTVFENNKENGEDKAFTNKGTVKVSKNNEIKEDE